MTSEFGQANLLNKLHELIFAFLISFQVQAIDEDKGVNGQVKYSIVQQPNQKGAKFSVNQETGEVITNKVSYTQLPLISL